LIAAGADTHVLLWRGTAMTSVVAVALSAAGLDCEAHHLGVTLPDTTPDEAAQILRQLSRPIDAGALSTFVRTLEEAKYDEFAPLELLRDLWARSNAALVAALPGLVAGLRMPKA
jgi:ATP-dependent Lhr-like helicase